MDTGSYGREYGEAVIRYSSSEAPQHVGYQIVSNTLNHGYRLEPPLRRDQSHLASLYAADDLRSTLQGVENLKAKGARNKKRYYIAHVYADGSMRPMNNEGHENSCVLEPHQRQHGNYLDSRFSASSFSEPHMADKAPFTEPRERDILLTHLAAITGHGTPFVKAVHAKTYGMWGAEVDPFRRAALERRDFMPFLALADWIDEHSDSEDAPMLRVSHIIRRKVTQYMDRWGHK